MRRAARCRAGAGEHRRDRQADRAGSGSATRLVDRMAKAGLVERHADPQDRRKSLVTLAPEARARIGAAWDVPGKAFGAVLETYRDEELAVIADCLERAGAVGRAQAERLAGPDAS
ncbi:MarR family winged helix-turn-helix transcriptional regulator [Rhodococcus maanshanensis]|nr:MarR family transcriptional regulator [Rhodococcus maanshanensis]